MLTAASRLGRLTIAAVVALIVATATARAGDDPLRFAVIVLAGICAYGVTGLEFEPTEAPAPASPVLDLGGGWSLVGEAVLDPAYLDALRAWCAISTHWEPVWRPKRGGRARTTVLRPDNPSGTVSRLLGQWITETRSQRSHDELLAAMDRLGLLERYPAGDAFGWSLIPLEAANERLAVRIGSTLRRSRGASTRPSH